MTPEFEPLLREGLAGWTRAGTGSFEWLADGTLEIDGGPGLLWYAEHSYGDFVLQVQWRTMRGDANSGVFIRVPPLANDPQPAIDRGYEIQIDDYGVDHSNQKLYSPLHLTGAIYELAPVRFGMSRGAALWNTFEITARGASIDVVLNGTLVSHLHNAMREARGHIALQAHHAGAPVQFRDVSIRPL